MYTLEDVYKTFPSGCTEDYKILRAFEMGKQAREKRIAELEEQIEKMKCCQNCSHLCGLCELGINGCYVCSKWEVRR